MFITRQLKLETPILEFKIFSYRLFTLTTVLGMIIFSAMIASTVILPLYMQIMLGYNAFHSGLMLLPGAIVMGVMNPITGTLFDKYGAKWLLRTGLFLATVTTFMFSNLSVETSFLYLAVLNAIRMLGISMVMMPSTTLGLNQLPKQLISHGTAMNNTLRQIAGAVGTAILVTVMTTTSLDNGTVSGAIQGVNTSFLITGFVLAGGLILSFRINDQKTA